MLEIPPLHVEVFKSGATTKTRVTSFYVKRD